MAQHRIKRRATVLPVLAGALIASTAHAETYYVESGGSDGATGLTGAPWATLQHAADQVVAGDTVMVAAGTYVGFALTTGGTNGSPITFQAESGVTIDTDNASTPDGINVEGADYVVIEGFHVAGVTRAGIRCALSNFVTIRGNTAENNGVWGIFSGFCDDILVEENDCSGSVDQHGVYVSNSADRPTVRGNVLWDNNGCGLHMNGDISMGGDGLIEDALVEGNIIFGNGNGGGSAINCDGCQNGVIQNNLVFDTHASGISLYAIDAAEGSKNNLVVNNTVIVAADGRWCLNIQSGSTDNTAYNNILLNLHGFRGSLDISPDSLSGFVSDHNVVMDRFTTDGASTVLTLAEWTGATGQDVASVVAASAALFVDADNDDYHLQENAPAADVGTPTSAPPADLDGNARPYGPGYDIGAYEWCGDDCEPASSSSSTSTSSTSSGTGGSGGEGTGGAGGTTSSSGAALDDADDDNGCGCMVPGERRAAGPIVLGLLLMGALGLRARRRTGGSRRPR